MSRPLSRAFMQWGPPLARPWPRLPLVPAPWVPSTARRAASAAAGDGGGGGSALVGGRVVDTELKDEAERSYISYAMSVIVGRALPDVRDGLKPVHRRILYAMHGLGLGPSTPYRKCARVVGEVLGKYHPHGDTAVYDALVRLAQDFSMRAPLVAGHGNFGSLDADPPAAMRYTECRLQPLSADVLLRDLGAETVDMAPNFDGSVDEPTVLPARVPLLLVNGSSGIAVGIATRVPPHNLGEVVAAMRQLIANPDATTADLMRHIPAPDFPTGGEILDLAGVREAFETGRGPVTVRGRVDIETDDGTSAKRRRRKGAAAAVAQPIATASLDGDEAASSSGRSRIVITELPYQTNKAAFVARIAELVDEGNLPGVTDVRDESDRTGMRVVVEVRRGAYPRVVLNTLYKTTALQARFSVNLVALIDGTPRTLSLKECLQHFIDFRRDVVERRARFELAKAEKRAHIVAGLLLAQADLDAVVRTVRAAADGPAAAAALVERHGLSPEQAEAVLAMALRRLTSLEAGKLQAEAAELAARTEDLKSLLASPQRVLKVIEDEAVEMAAKHGNPRRSTINVADDGELGDEALVPDDESIVVYSRRGFVKRMSADTFAAQARGGRGKAGAGLRGEEDGVGDVLAVRNHDTVLFFTHDGGVRTVRAHQIPAASRAAAGTAVTKVINVPRGDCVAALLATRDFSPDDGLLLLTKNGLVKRTAFDQFRAVRANGIVAIKLREGTGDELTWVARAPPGARVLLAASDGWALLFAVDSLRSSSRASTGVTAMRLAPGASLVGMSVLPPLNDGQEGVGVPSSPAASLDSAPSFLFVTKQGYGKRVAVSDFRVMARANRGVRAIRLNDGDEVAALLTVPAGSRDDLLIGTASGVMLRIAAAAVRPLGRGARGVRLVRLDEGDSVQTVTTLGAGDGEEGVSSEESVAAAAPLQEASATAAKPKSAYAAFCAAERPAVLKSMPGARLPEVSRELGARWRALGPAEKAAYAPKG